MNAPRDQEEPRVVVNDKRRIDPRTGEVRSSSGGGFSNPFARPRADAPDDPANAAQPLTVHPDESALSTELEAAQQESAERLADLQRVSAEYANYRKRVDRDREAVVATAKAQVLTQLLSVVDDIDRAEAHGDLTGAFKAVADRLAETLERLGLSRFAAVGDGFDPERHEAVQFATSADVSAQTVTTVMRRGYTLGDRLVRAAVVAVTGPEDESSTAAPGSSEEVPAPRTPTADDGTGAATGHPIADGHTDPSSAPGDSGGAGGTGPDGSPLHNG